MSDVPKRGPMVSEEHRGRRRAVFERASAAHHRAAIVHEEAAGFLGLHGKIDRAAYHRRAAEVQDRRADDSDAADAQ